MKLQQIYYTLYERKKNSSLNKEQLFKKLLEGNVDPAELSRLQSYVANSEDSEVRELWDILFPEIAVEKFILEKKESFKGKALNYFRSQNGTLRYVDAPDNLSDYADSDAFKNYLNIARTVNYFNEVIENDYNVDLSLENAYKIMVLFPARNNTPQLSNFDKFFEIHLKNKDNQRRIHDVFISEMPSGITKIKMWQDIISKKPDFASTTLLKEISLFPQIENLVTGDTITPKEFKKLLGELSYRNYQEAPNLADFLRGYRVYDERIFDRILDLTKKGVLKFRDERKLHFADKVEDNIPNITIDWRDIEFAEGDQSAKGYYLTKLPNGDPRALILGRLTNCCQLITGHGEGCVINGMNLSDNGFYLLLKAKNPDEFDVMKFNDPQWWDNGFSKDIVDIKAQFYLWKNQNNFVIDSLEGIGKKSVNKISDDALHKILKRFGEELIEQGCDRLNIGKGATPKFLHDNSKETKSLEVPRGNWYYDSQTQYVLVESERLKKKRKELLEIFPECDVELFSSVRGIDIFKSVIEKDPTIKEQKPKILQDLIKPLTCYDNEADYQEFLDRIKPFLSMGGKVYIITSYQAIRLYKQINLTPEDLDGIDTTSNLDFLSSESALKCYKTGLVTFHELKNSKGMEGLTLSLLVSENAVECYEKGFVSFSELQKLQSYDLISLVTSDEALSCYEEGLVSFDELINVPENKICNLISYNAQELYKKKVISFDELKEFDANKLRGLTSNQANKCYKTGKVSIMDLKEIDESERIWALTCQGAVECYKKGFVSFPEVKNLESDKISVLFSEGALDCYKNKLASFSELNSCDLTELREITSSDFVDCFKTGGISVNDLKGLEHDVKYAMTSSGARYCYETGCLTAKDFKGRVVDEIRAMTSYDARYCYEKGWLTAKDFEGHGLAEMEMMTSFDAASCYETGCLTAKDFAGHTVDEMKVMTSYDARYGYEKGWLTAKDFAGLTVDEINAMTSFDVRDFYQKELLSVKDFAGHTVDEINAMTSLGARKCYESGWLTAKDLSGHTVDEINAMTSLGARDCYEGGWLTAKDFAGHTVDEINAMTSFSARDCYESGWLTAKDFSGHTVDEINAMTSFDVRDFYQKELLSAKDFAGRTVDEINAMTSFKARSCYEKKWISAKDFEGRGVDEINVMTSYLAQQCYNKKFLSVVDFVGCKSKEIFLLIEEKLNAKNDGKASAEKPSPNPKKGRKSAKIIDPGCCTIS